VAVTEASETKTADSRAESLFSASILISGIRCMLTYVVFPFVAPVIGVASGIGSTLGLILGAVAIVANVLSIRRFQRSNHRYKWPVSALNAGIIVLLLVLMALDLEHLFS
jgi:heme O synthase-like polyprenyltransferase